MGSQDIIIEKVYTIYDFTIKAITFCAFNSYSFKIAGKVFI